jgi:putative Holliday junction resolvase
MKLLALDVGDRRIGVAVSDATGLIASPLATIHRGSKADDYAKIAQMLQEQRAEGLVIGQPLNEDGSVGPQARRIERYVAALKDALCERGIELPVVLWDERMSSIRAQEAMIAAGHRARKRRARIDEVAAAVILQDYLDEHRPSLPGQGGTNCQ